MLSGVPIRLDIQPGLFPSFPEGLVEVGGTLYLSASGGSTGQELWKSDGTQAGTVLVKDIFPQGYSDPVQLTNFLGTLVFIANDGVHGPELWKSDGTSTGTVMLKDIRSGSDGAFIATASRPSYFAEAGGVVYFRANDGVSGVELWRSDGTEAGTVRVKDIRSGSYGSNPHVLTNVDGTLFFEANDGETGYELWKSDGTETGTVRVKDIRPGVGSYPTDFVSVGGVLYFGANDGTSGRELWRSDGTALGTFRVNDIRAGAGGSAPEWPGSAGNRVFFRANDGTSGVEPWTSDGTAAGTFRLGDLRTGSADSSPMYFTDVNGTVYFSANDGVAGEELWRTNGTAAGTFRVKDINPGAQSGFGIGFAVADGVMYFIADDGVHGIELWRSDGTSAGTVQVHELRADAFSPEIDYLTNVGGRIFFVAVADNSSGKELWVYDPRPRPPGDFNGDQSIDGADILLWQRTLGSSIIPPGDAADGDSSGMVDVQDLRIAEIHFGGDDFGGSAELASTIAVPGANAGNIHQSADVDVFRFTATPGLTHRFHVNLGNLAGAALRVLAGDGTTVLAVDDNGGPADIAWTPPDGGTYYLEVKGDGASLGGYQLTASRDDHSDVASGATVVAVPSTTDGTIDVGADVDWFRFTVPSGNVGWTYTLATLLNGLPTSTLRLIGPDGLTPVAVDEDGGAALIEWMPPSSGDYYLQVTGNGATGGYRASVQSAPPANELSYTGSSLAESFDGLGSSTVSNFFSATAGVQAALPGVPGFSGTRIGGSGGSPVSLTAGTGSNVGAGVYSFGAAGNPERALGALASGTNIMAFGFSLRNDSNLHVTSITVALTQENWRVSTSAQNTLIAQWGTSDTPGATPANYLTKTGFATATALNLVGPMPAGSAGALDGNLLANQIARSFVFSNLDLAPGERFYLRWIDADDAGSDAGIAIDNLELSFTTATLSALETLSRSSLIGDELKWSLELTSVSDKGLDEPRQNAGDGFMQRVADRATTPSEGRLRAAAIVAAIEHIYSHGAFEKPFEANGEASTIPNNKPMSSRVFGNVFEAFESVKDWTSLSHRR